MTPRTLAQITLTSSMLLPFISLSAYADTVDNWCSSYTTQEKRGLHKITIRKDGDKLKIHAIGNGFPDDIDWGESTAEVYPAETPGQLPRFIAHYSVGPARTMLIVRPYSGGNGPHSGGVVECESYAQKADKPQRFVQQLLQTEK